MSSFDGCAALLAKHAMPTRAKLPPAREIRLAVAQAQLHKQQRLPDYIIRTMKEEYDLAGSLRGAAKVLGVHHSHVGRVLRKRGQTRKANSRPCLEHGGLKYYFDGRYYIAQRRGHPAQMLHKVIWQEKHGPVPVGHYLVIRGAPTDFSRVECLPRAVYFRYILDQRRDRKKAA